MHLQSGRTAEAGAAPLVAASRNWLSSPVYASSLFSASAWTSTSSSATPRIVEQEGDVAKPHVLELGRRLRAMRGPSSTPAAMPISCSVLRQPTAPNLHLRAAARVSRTVQIEC